MNSFRLILAILVLLFAAYIVVMNWGCVIVSLRNKKRGIDQHHSTVPLLSAFITIIAMMVYPRAWPWMIAVPTLDIANWSLVWAPFGLMRELCRKKNAEPAVPPSAGPAGPPSTN